MQNLDEKLVYFQTSLETNSTVKKTPIKKIIKQPINRFSKNTYKFSKYLDQSKNRLSFSINSLNAILIINFPEKEKEVLLKNLATEIKTPLMTESGNSLLKDEPRVSINKNSSGSIDPIKALIVKIKRFAPCICVRVI